MKTEDFSSRSQAYIKSLIRQRTYLNAHHRTRADVVYLDAQIHFLKLHLLMNQYDDRQMAGFWMRHHDRIFALIPGVRCPSSASLTHKFNELKDEAGRIFTQSLITPDNVIPKLYGSTEIQL